MRRWAQCPQQVREGAVQDRTGGTLVQRSRSRGSGMEGQAVAERMPGFQMSSWAIDYMFEDRTA